MTPLLSIYCQVADQVNFHNSTQIYRHVRWVVARIRHARSADSRSLGCAIRGPVSHECPFGTTILKIYILNTIRHACDLFVESTISLTYCRGRCGRRSYSGGGGVAEVQLFPDLSHVFSLSMRIHIASSIAQIKYQHFAKSFH